MSRKPCCVRAMILKYHVLNRCLGPIKLPWSCGHNSYSSQSWCKQMEQEVKHNSMSHGSLTAVMYLSVSWSVKRWGNLLACIPSPVKALRRCRYYQYSAQLHNKPRTDTSQPVLCRKYKRNASIRSRMPSIVSNGKERPQRAMTPTRWCLDRPLQAHSHCSALFLPRSMASRTQRQKSGGHNKITTLHRPRKTIHRPAD